MKKVVWLMLLLAVTSTMVFAEANVDQFIGRSRTAQERADAH